MKFNTLTGKARAILFAVTVHTVFIGVLLVSFHWAQDVSTPLAAARKKPEPIQATVLSETKVEEELAEIQARKRMEQEAEQARVRKLERQASDALKRREEEERRLADIQRKLKAQERKRQEVEKKEAERRRKKKEKAEKERQRREKEEARKKKEAERKRKAAEKALQQKLAEEQAEHERRQQQLLNRYRLEYITNIKSAVEGNWIRPSGTAKGLRCKLKVTQTASGEVIDVSVTVSSGSASFDHSAVAAVFKASPLPKPGDPSVFDQNIVLTLLNPED